MRSPLARPIATYSIVARDPDNGRMGVAVQSHYFSVGSLAPSAEAGIGAAVIQSIPNLSYGYGIEGLRRMREGRSADEALAELLRADDREAFRQVALLDRAGRVAAHTGRCCVPEAGHSTGDGFACLANMMHRPDVWDAMAEAFRSARGDLGDRLFAALVAAEAEGGDLRGGHSAALLVVEAESGKNPLLDRVFDLRVEDHERPLDELRRLMRLQRAYFHSARADAMLARQEYTRALEEYAVAERSAPGERQLEFWRAVALANAGRLEDALPVFKQVFDDDPHWFLMARRLPRVGLLPDARETMTRILAQGKEPTES